MFEKMLVCMIVWSSEKVFLSRKVFFRKTYSSSVCDVSRYWRFVFLLHVVFRVWNVCGLEDVSRCCKSLVLALRRRNIFCLSADVHSQNCYCCLDANSLICDRGIRTERSRKFVNGKKRFLHSALWSVGLPRSISCIFEDVSYSSMSSVMCFPYMPHFTGKT